MNFSEKKLLITGGTGSFGQKMLNYFINNTDIKEVRVFSRDEEKQDRMRMSFSDSRIQYYVGDIRDYKSINYALDSVDYVFHAAALKQVPSCEFYPLEAVATNIMGASNVVDACIDNRVKKLVLLSTDKAVAPINAMGMTKALMEKIMLARSRASQSTILSATRYGNVMASRGSVIPLFIKQCKESQPITITDPNMTRFLMSLEESIDLVLFAFEKAQGGEIFVQKSPSCTIKTLALAIQTIFNAKNEIKIIGTRHGEKSHETLIGREDYAKKIDMGKFFLIPPDNRDLNYNKYFIDGNTTFTKDEEYTSYNTEQLNVENVIKKLLALEYIQAEMQSKKFLGVAK